MPDLTITDTDIAAMEQFYRTNLINSLSGFKSVNLVGTINPQGVTNLAVFSQVFHLGAHPALMGMIVRPDSVPRHTLANLLETGSFTLNHLRADFYRQAHQTSASYAGSEFEACGFTPWFSEKIAAPYVRESSVKIGLAFRERIDLAINGTVMIIGEVVEIRAKLKKAMPGTAFCRMPEKKRSRPKVCLPALVTTTSSPAKR